MIQIAQRSYLLMELLRCGLSGCIVTHPDDSSKVIKLFINEFSQWSQKQETRPDLLQALRTVDPKQEFFTQCLEELDVAYLKKHVTLALIEKCQEQLTAIQMTKFGPKADFSLVEFNKAFLRGIVLPKLTFVDKLKVNVVDRLMKSLSLLHSAGWYHNDIHANNVMLGPDGNPRILDWGEAETEPLDRVTTDYENMLSIL